MGRHEIYTTTVAHYLAPITEFLEDPNVSEVMINKSDEIYIERDGALHKGRVVLHAGGIVDVQLRASYEIFP